MAYLIGTLDTTATYFFDETLKVVFTIVIGDFLPLLDILLGNNINPSSSIDSLGIGSARMIGIASRIVTRAAVDIPFGIDVKHVTVVPLVTDTGRDTLTDVFNNSRSLGDRSQSK